MNHDDELLTTPNEEILGDVEEVDFDDVQDELEEEFDDNEIEEDEDEDEEYEDDDEDDF